MGSPVTRALHRFWFAGWGFDRLYMALFVSPFIGMARLNKKDAMDSLYRGIAKAVGMGGKGTCPDRIGEGEVVRAGNGFRRPGFRGYSGVHVMLVTILFIPVCAGILAWSSQYIDKTVAPVGFPRGAHDRFFPRGLPLGGARRRRASGLVDCGVRGALVRPPGHHLSSGP